MDFWNRKKVRELELEISHKESEIESLRNQLQLAEKKIKGERVCGGYCKQCTHGIQDENFFMGAVYNTIACELDCKCKDFQTKRRKAVRDQKDMPQRISV